MMTEARSDSAATKRLAVTNETKRLFDDFLDEFRRREGIRLSHDEAVRLLLRSWRERQEGASA